MPQILLAIGICGCTSDCGDMYSSSEGSAMAQEGNPFTSQAEGYAAAGAC